MPVKLTTLLVAACFALGVPMAFAADPPQAQAQAAKSKPAAKKKAGKKKAPKLAAGAMVAPAAGMVVHIDPNTGEFLKEPVPGRQTLVLSPAERNAFSTSHEGLVEVPSQTPGGGYKIDLQGRFQSPLIATIGADGKITMRHAHETPAPAERK